MRGKGLGSPLPSKKNILIYSVPVDKTSSSPFANCDSCSVSVGVGTPLIARLASRQPVVTAGIYHPADCVRHVNARPQSLGPTEKLF